MKIISDLTQVNLQQETILTIGAFDGVHRGHQALIHTVVDRARATGRLATLITFHPHPVVVLAPDRAPPYLTTPGEKAALLERLGIDLVVLLSFDRRLAATPARDFMEMVSRQLKVRELWVGSDFALGRNREGTVPRLQELGQELGYHVHVIEPVLGSGEVISSSRIRTLLREGLVEDATRLLGRYPSLSGEVVPGAHRGHRLGFPTANLEVRPERAIPADGVYAVFAVLGAERYPGVANVGIRPSFDNGQRLVEVHIFDFDQDIYGCDLVVEFVARLREERRFTDIQELIAQMRRDSDAARQILGEAKQTPDLYPTPPSRKQDRVDCRYRYQELEHTADRALWVWGERLADLFMGAAEGMYRLMADLDGLVATEWREIRLEAWDRETLLVRWLNELLFYTESEGLMFVEFEVESLVDPAPAGSSGAMLIARVGGISVPATKAHVKAATFHNLEIVQDETGWTTEITFDV